MKKILVGMLIFVVASCGYVSAATVSAVSDGTWDSDIWSTAGLVGAVTTGLRPATGDTVQINANVELDVDAPTMALLKGYGGSLDFGSGNSATVSGNFLGAMNGKNVSYTISSGSSLTVQGDYFKLANGTGSNTTAVFQQNGGTVTHSGGVFFMTNNASDNSTYWLKSGIMNVNKIVAGNGNATFNWLGGELNAVQIQIDLTNSSSERTGTLAPGGSGVVGSTEFLFGTSYSQSAGSVLGIDISSSTSYDAVTMGSGSVVLGGLIDLNLLSSYTPNIGDTFDIFEADSIVNNSLALSGDASNFVYDIVNSGDRQILQLEYVPEPTTIALLSLGASVLVFKKRS